MFVAFLGAFCDILNRQWPQIDLFRINAIQNSILGRVTKGSTSVTGNSPWAVPIPSWNEIYDILHKYFIALERAFALYFGFKKYFRRLSVGFAGVPAVGILAHGDVRLGNYQLGKWSNNHLSFINHLTQSHKKPEVALSEGRGLIDTGLEKKFATGLCVPSWTFRSAPLSSQLLAFCPVSVKSS